MHWQCYGFFLCPIEAVPLIFLLQVSVYYDAFLPLSMALAVCIHYKEFLDVALIQKSCKIWVVFLNAIL